MPRKKISKRETENLLEEIDHWMDEETSNMELLREKTKPTPPLEVEPTVEIVPRKPIYSYDDRREFDPEKYDVANSLAVVTPEEYVPGPDEKTPQKKAYRSPKNDPVFKAKWNSFIQNVTSRDNFNRSHLEQLTVLCDLFVEYEILIQSLKRTGYTFIINTAIGAVPKAYPEVAQLNRTRGEIRNYSRMLGLLLVKDKSEKEPDEDEWE